jgi:hypothetical protein
MGPHLDPGQRQEIVDEPGHPLRLAPHDLQEPLAGLRIVAGGPLKRLDEAQERCQRRPEFVARIGHEVDPHVFEAPRRGEVPEEQDHALLGGILAERPDLNLEGPLGRNALGILHLPHLTRPQHLVDAVEHVGAAQGERQRVLELERGQERSRRLVHLDHDRAAVDQNDRVRDGSQEGLCDARPLGRAALQGHLERCPAAPAGKHHTAQDDRPGSPG